MSISVRNFGFGVGVKQAGAKYQNPLKPVT